MRNNNKMDFEVSHLGKEVIQRLGQQNITKLFPIQKLVIPEIIENEASSSGFPPRDICVSAPTGSGKTLCYVLPIIENIIRSRNNSRALLQTRYSEERIRFIRALIVVPVVNLAAQVAQVFRQYSDCCGADQLPIKIALITGKQNFQQECDQLYQKAQLLTPVNPRSSESTEIEIASADIVVATPGRLLDHLRLEGNKFCLKFLRYLVLDEADRLMNDFRVDWLGEIERAVYDADCPLNVMTNRHRIAASNIEQLLASGRMPLQKILLSATLSHNPEQLQQLNLFQPKHFDVSGAILSSSSISNNISKDSGSTQNVGIPEELDEKYVKVSLKYKPLAVFRLIREQNIAKVLCFVDKIESSRKLAHVLESLGVENVDEFASTVNKYRMQRILARFGKNSNGILICTDVMARGIDMQNVNCVVNYDRPKALKTYVHRIGRTARAGEKGVAFTLIEKSEENEFKKLFIDRSDKLKEFDLDQDGYNKLEESYKEALSKVKDQLTKEKEKKLKFSKSHVRSKKKVVLPNSKTLLNGKNKRSMKKE